jgi:ABC-type Fe3+ transport system permease subunit
MIVINKAKRGGCRVTLATCFLIPGLQDISQVFLLNEKYKIKFVSELREEVTMWLRSILWIGVASALICTILVVSGAYDLVAGDFIGEAGQVDCVTSKMPSWGKPVFF